MVAKIRSVVWKYFDKTDKDHVMCRLCKRLFKFNSNTSNMKAHLTGKHPDASLTVGDEDYIPPRSYDMPSTSTAVQNMVDHQGQSESEDETQVKEEVYQTFQYQKLVVPCSMRSVYWKCFGFPAGGDGEILTKSKIVCLLCKNVITYNRNTSNLKMHLQNKHQEELMQLELTAEPRTSSMKMEKKKKDRKSLKAQGNMYASDIGGSLTVNEKNSHNTVEVGEGELMEVVKRTQNLRNNVSDGQNCTTLESLHPFMIPIHHSNVSEAIAEFVVMDLQMPDVVEGRGCQRFIATLKSPCEIPSKSKLIEEVLPKMYDTVKEQAQAIVHSVKTEVALTVEEWDAIHGETYVTFSICYQQPEKDDNLYNKVLTTVDCPARAQTHYWTMVLDNIFEEWRLSQERIKAVVCGSCRVELIGAIQIRGLTVVPCFLQTIQEVCTKTCFDQEEVKEILAKCRSYIYLVYNTNNALAALRIQDHLMSLEETPLVADYPRAWLSTYLMLEGFLARRTVLSSILDNVEPHTYDKDMVTITDDEWTLIEDVLAVLQPFKVTMMTLSEEKAPLVSLLKPLLLQLLTSHLQVKADDSVNAQLLKVTMKTLLSEKYNDQIVDKLLQGATAVDPRFKNLPNLMEESKAALEGVIRQELIGLVQRNPVEIKQEEPEKKKPRMSGIMMLMGDVCPSNSGGISHEDRSNLEIAQYQSETQAPLDHPPLAWWNRNSPKCPNLSRLALQYLCVPATVFRPERIPIEQQISFDSKRAVLTPDIIDRILFLNSNFPFVV